jgi:hypothetical protein
MRVVDDLNRWQSHAQCIFAAPTEFRMYVANSHLAYHYLHD